MQKEGVACHLFSLQSQLAGRGGNAVTERLEMPVDDEKILLDALQSSKISGTLPMMQKSVNKHCIPDREKALLDGITVDCSPLAMFSEDSSRWAHMFTVKEGRKDRYHLLGTDGDELSITVRGYVASANLPDTNLRCA